MTCLQSRVPPKLYQLREEHSIVKALRTNMSGLPWSDAEGLNIGLDEQNTWKIYSMVSFFQLIACISSTYLLSAHPKAKPFSNKGFPLYDRMVPLMPSLAKGTHAF